MTAEDNSTPQRTATQVLLELDEKITKVLQTVSLTGATNKMILDRLNKIYNYIDMIEKEQQLVSEISKTTIPQPESLIAPNPVQPEEIIQVDDMSLGTRRTSRVENTLTTTKKQEIINHPEDRKVPVVQRITDKTGKDLFMAKISIMDVNQKLVLETKTNASGKWQAHLVPGTYIVQIVKTDTATKQKIEGKQTITINPVNGTMQLPVAIIKG
jgi:hypothetical protein